MASYLLTISDPKSVYSNGPHASKMEYRTLRTHTIVGAVSIVNTKKYNL